MRVDPAVVTAGSIVLPKEIIRFNQFITHTDATEGLEGDDTFFGDSSRYYPYIVHYEGGSLSICYGYQYSWADLVSDHNRRQVHVFRATNPTTSQSLVNQLDAAYQRNPWTKYAWFRDNFRVWAELMPMPSQTKAGYLAYYQSPAKRARNIQTPIKPGRWLSKYFGAILTQEEIQKYGLEWEAEFGPIDVTITQDADEIEAVYQAAHLGSCMYFPAEDWAGSCHPARVYGGNLDLGIAYIGSQAEPVGRCLVWPAKKIFLDKMYGDDFRLRNALIQAGFKAGEKSEFTGARLQRIVHRPGVYVMPYIDTHSWADDNGTHIILGHGDIQVQHSDYTEGLSVHDDSDIDDDDDTISCDDCYSHETRDYMTYVSNHGDICDSCLSANYFLCEETSDYHPNPERASTPSGWRVSGQGVRNGDWFHCPLTDKWYPEDTYAEIELIEGGTCVEEHAQENGFFCIASEKWSLQTSMMQIKLENGDSVHLNAFKTKEELDTFVAAQGTTVALPSPETVQEAA